MFKPEILAPAGDMPSALAALAAGADAVYLGLKHFSARMQAENFSVTDLAGLAAMAHSQDRKIYVAMNTLVKPGDAPSAYRLLKRLARDVKPDALIIQDIGLFDLAAQAGLECERHLSTLANVTHPLALEAARNLGASRVILPRELSIDEIKSVAAACPEGLSLECFVHGALCYCVSGRCYWSSLLGGKSGLRGRCVQPCRRMYRPGIHQPRDSKNKGKRFFSCLDLSLDVLVKTLATLPQIHSWKIEGRKKGPHYVYHVTRAYAMLRDNPGDSSAKKAAEEILAFALGRPSTRARFLPQREASATAPDEHTSSGLLAGKITFSPEGKPLLKPRLELQPGDLLRLGVKDEDWHCTIPVSRRVPKAGSLVLRLPKHKTPKLGASLYLIDRRDPELMKILRDAEKKLANFAAQPGQAVETFPKMPRPVQARRGQDMDLVPAVPKGRETRRRMALWLSPKSAREISRTIMPRITFWLPPVIWPSEEELFARLLKEVLRDGASRFVCNAPWQTALFADPANLDLTAGPFCNTANAPALAALAAMGYKAAFASPELPAEDLLALPRQSPLPLGLVISGWWPVGISRFALSGLKPNEPFASPKGEAFWARNYGANLWIYPAWPLDLTNQKAELEAAGYSFFTHMGETPPAALADVRRQSGKFNWEGELL